MKRIGLIVGVLVLSLGLMLGQTGISQMGQRGPADPAASQDAMSIQMETHLLRAMSEAGLGVDQLQRIQGALADVQSAEGTRLQRQQELRDFLYGWQGSPDELDSALEPYEQALDEARQAYQDARQSAVAEVRSILTIAQGRALSQALHGGMGTDNAQGHGAMRGHAMGPGRMGARAGQGQQMRGGTSMRGTPGHGPAASPSQRGMPSSRMDQSQPEGPRMGARMQRQGQASGQGGGMQGHCPMMNSGSMGGQQRGASAGSGIGPIFMEHLEMWQQVIGEKLNRLEGQSS